jgi:Heterokaryon incompatibility protein (HET)
VWKPSPEVVMISENENRPLKIQTHENRPPHEISWHGLVQAAHSARFLGCRYLWLDLLCIDQLSHDGEKEAQIENMGNIYERAKAVIVMVGGVAAVQGVDKTSDWIDRAWTLQEATLCKQTYALVDWPYKEDVNVTLVRSHEVDGATRIFHGRFQKLVNNIAIIPLQQLLEFPDLTTSDIVLQRGFAIRCFGDDPYDDSARNSLLSVMKAENESMRQCGAWRSMFLRTSKRAQDMVFSMMHLIGVKMRVTYKRTLHELYRELLRKAAHNGYPAFLSIGNLHGDIIPRDSQFGLWPDLPTFHAHSLPTYLHDSYTLPTRNHISSHNNYIYKFDICFKEDSLSVTSACSYILEILDWQVADVGDILFKEEFSQIRPEPTLKREEELYSDFAEFKYARLSLSNSEGDDVEGTCAYKGNIAMGGRVLVIGQRAKYDLASQLGQSHSSVFNSWYVYFLDIGLDEGWTRVGSGLLQIQQDRFGARRHIQFGEEEEEGDCNCSI